MEIQPTDIALFLVSFAACLYCIVLSRRLKKLQDTKDGLGATIMTMTKSVSAMSSATKDTRAQAGELASRLSHLMKEANETCERMSEMQASLAASYQERAEAIRSVPQEADEQVPQMIRESSESDREL